jgi:hypothetical protein
VTHNPLIDSDEDQAPAAHQSSFPTLIVAAVALLAAAVAAFLVVSTDPNPRTERLFVAMVLLATAALGSITARAAGGHSERPRVGSLRAFRRGLLFGLACAGAVVLQLNAALSLTNLAFLLLVLLIAEMIFLAHRQHPV